LTSIVAPRIVVVTSLGEDHVDWHGSLEQYRRDKLSLTRAPGEHVTLVADNATLREHESQIGGDLRYVSAETSRRSRRHSDSLANTTISNVALALAAAATLTGEQVETIRAVPSNNGRRSSRSTPRTTDPRREREIGSATRRYIDDGLATSVLPTLAALEVFCDDPIALIAGGFDRGVDYSELADALVARRRRRRSSPWATRVLGSPMRCANVAMTSSSTPPPPCRSRPARAGLTGRRGVVLLSPAAPSFDRYHNWEERSEDFTHGALARVVVSQVPRKFRDLTTVT
jgi:UDP-N-acetylmuramoylalanine-D-glutamate ligase